MRKLFVLVASVALISACGGASKSPTAPSSSQGAPSTGSPVTPASATISGLVQQTSGAAASGMTLAVVNTALSTRSDSSGHFTLTNVPSGDVQLRISGQGADAIAPVGNVQPSQTLDIVVTVSGSSAKVDTPGHNEAESEIKGVIDAVPPKAAAGTFSVAGRVVHTTASTQFEDGSHTIGLSDLKVGENVEVHGTLSGDTLTATRVEILPDAAPAPGNPGANEPEPEPETDMKGAISNLKGSASSFTFDIGSQHLTGNSSTRIDKSGDGGSDGSDGSNSSGPGSGNGSFSDLKNGLTVEVHATASGSTLTATRIHIENDNNDNENEPNEVELKGALGTVTAIGAGCSANTISSTVGGTTFTTSSSTVFETSCASLKKGDTVEVKGTRTTATGPVSATRVKKED